MSNKVILEKEQIQNIVTRLNNTSCTIEDIALELGVNRKTITRKINEQGYVYNRSEAKYECLNAPVEKKPIGRPQLDEEVIKKTYAIPTYLDKALRRKAIEEDKTVTDIIKEILQANIEEIYFKNIR